MAFRTISAILRARFMTGNGFPASAPPTFRSGRRRASKTLQALVPAALAVLSVSAVRPALAASDVPTYHGDNLRTGWNTTETKLTSAAVQSAAFQKLLTVPVDAQIDAQPLYASAVTVAGASHNVVYVVTEKDTIYGIDADSGKILAKRSLGTPIPLSTVPGGCINGDSTVGITATPVIDRAAGAIYVIAYRMIGGQPNYMLYALDLATLASKVTPTRIVATANLSNGASFDFNPAVTRLRAGLLLSGGKVYAGFTSFCDNLPSQVRGWVLGWDASTLAPLPANRLLNLLPTSPKTYFLSTVWMSGYGIAADQAGALYFVTGNSDPASKATYPNNLDESVVKLSPDLSRVASFFTPSTTATGSDALNQDDLDFGAGGALLLPRQPGKYPHLAVAAGKIGQMYLLNRDQLGGNGKGADKVLGTYPIGECFCGQSYYKGADGIGRIVTSGGNRVLVWKVITSATAAPTLVQESNSPRIVTGQDHGFFTTVSSAGLKSPVVWALSRPVSATNDTVNLYAIDPAAIDGAGQSKIIKEVPAGVWPKVGGNANLMPTVANGRVYVGTYQALTIFGLASTAAKAAPNTVTTGMQAEDAAQPAPAGRQLYGTLLDFHGTSMTLRDRDGKPVTVNTAAATKAGTAGVPVIGRAYLVRGTVSADKVLKATSVQRAKQSPDLWGADR